MVSENENSLHAGALTENVDIRLMATINTDMSHLTPEEKSRFRIGKNPKKGNEFYIIDHKLTIKIKNSNIKFRAIFPPDGDKDRQIARQIQAREIQAREIQARPIQARQTEQSKGNASSRYFRPSSL